MLGLMIKYFKEEFATTGEGWSIDRLVSGCLTTTVQQRDCCRCTNTDKSHSPLVSYHCRAFSLLQQPPPKVGALTMGWAG